MKRILKSIISIIIIVIGILVAFSINYGILDELIIKDACSYDISNSNNKFIFNLFYEISSNTGYHPEPSYFNFGITFFLGLFLGLFFAYRLIWKRKL